MGPPTLSQNRHSDDVAWSPNRKDLHVLAGTALAATPDDQQDDGHYAPRELEIGTEPASISNKTAADVALSTSGLALIPF